MMKKLVSECEADGDKIFYQIACANMEGRNNGALKLWQSDYFHIWYWSWNSNTLANWSKEPTHWKRLWSWERLRAGEGGDRGWDGWMASPTQWTWVWADSQKQWRTGKPVLPCAAVHGVTKSQTWLSNWTNNSEEGNEWKSNGKDKQKSQIKSPMTCQGT